MTSAINAADGANSGAAVPIMLTELRLPTIKRLWADLAAQSNREGWPAERLLHTLLGHEMAERETRRLARARADSGLPPGKSLAEFDFAAVPAVSKAHVMALPRPTPGSARVTTCSRSARQAPARRTCWRALAMH